MYKYNKTYIYQDLKPTHVTTRGMKSKNLKTPAINKLKHAHHVRLNNL